MSQTKTLGPVSRPSSTTASPIPRLVLVAALALGPASPGIAWGMPLLRALQPRVSGGAAFSWERLGGWLWGLLAQPAPDDAASKPPSGPPSNPATATPSVQVVPVQPTVVPPPPPNPPGLRTTTDPNG